MVSSSDYLDNDEEESSSNIVGGTSFANMQRAALTLYGRWLATETGLPINDDEAVTKTEYLSLTEVEQIVREHGHCFGDGGYALAADTQDELNETLRRLMAALMDRILSNVVQAGVRDGLLECSFDSAVNDFVFDATEKGNNLAAEHRKQIENDKPD